MSKSKDVIVIGAGAIGCSIAYHLGRRGISTRVVDRESIAVRASGKALGGLHLRALLGRVRALRHNPGRGPRRFAR